MLIVSCQIICTSWLPLKMAILLTSSVRGRNLQETLCASADLKAPFVLAREGQPEEALGLIDFVLGQPQTWRETRDKVQCLYEELVAELPPPVVAAAREWNKNRMVKDVSEAVLAWLKGEKI